ncbi:MAG: PD-(D/E)XK nuclease family protein [Burkholderiales bacterium]|nr:PD-(D/E)XK nuclease family protein [Burkholderiales bacterium]
MATTVRLTLEDVDRAPGLWDEVADRATRWVATEGVSLRDVCVLVPFAQLLPWARRAFAREGGWMPRVETTTTLAASLGPAPVARPGQITFDATIDALGAAALLRSQAWGAAWARRDPRGFEQAAGALVRTAHELARAAFAVPAAERAAHWVEARDLLAPMSGPGAIERLLARVALEWACDAPPPETDRLFLGAAPAAWIAVQAGGPDPLVARLLDQAKVPCLVIDTDAPEHDPFGGVAASRVPALSVCASFEHEAQCAAAQVLAHVQGGAVPVALIAQDRLLVRRVRALLEREALRLLDETGWTLSTTRAAAQVMTLLRAAHPQASTDAVLDWLKAGTSWTGDARADAAAIESIESTCRRGPVTRAAALAGASLQPAAARLWGAAAAALSRLSIPRRQPLVRWLTALAAALTDCGALRLLQLDDAGQQVIAALRLMTNLSPDSAWSLVASQSAMEFDEFRAWVDAALERATFVPTPLNGEPAHVVIVPLARAMLRPFAAVVFPGADDKRLGAWPTPTSLLGDAQASALGLPNATQRRGAELLAFAQMLAAPRVTLMRRRLDGTDPLADSPLVERLRLALAARGLALATWHDPRITLQLAATPIRRSAPSAPGLLPERLSASACEALRACPYRFFALNMLRLREDDELEREIEKRDYGTWLHAVLFEFHRDRQVPASSEAEVARLLALAAASREAQGIGDADFLPYAASFASFAPRYIAWLHERDAQGARWLRGEDDVSARPPMLDGTELRGIIDRIDEVRTGAGAAIELIDYKTGSAAGLNEKVRQPLEDTQLAFYAALMRTRTELPLRAVYLALDGSKGLEEVEHPDVEVSAAMLVEGLAHDLRRLRRGAGLPALGVGATCEHCAARGICRRDHWADDDTDARIATAVSAANDTRAGTRGDTGAAPP